MVLIDTVYQRVLALANKEQRGYITPQEFNLFANQAQMDIFEQYFYDINQFGRLPGNDTEYSDMLNYLEEKISIFESSINDTSYPEDMYKIGSVQHTNLDGEVIMCEQVNVKDVPAINNSPLLKPTQNRTMYTLGSNNITIYPSSVTNVTINYIRRPEEVNWTYVVVGGKPLVHNSPSVGYQDFELHPSEETKLVMKILTLAGITLKDPGLYQVAGTEDNKNIQQEKQ